MKDVLSHFFLRMAFCQTEELRRWFLSQESTLFRCELIAIAPQRERPLTHAVLTRYRLDKMTRDEKLHFMKLNGLAYQEVELTKSA